MAVLHLAATSARAGGSLLANAGMEIDGGGGVPAAWFGKNLSDDAIDCSSPYQGSCAFRFVGEPGSVTSELRQTVRNIAGQPGDVLLAGFWLKGTLPPGSSFKVQVQTFAGTTLLRTIVFRVAAGDRDWTRFARSFSMGVAYDTVRVRLLFRGTTGDLQVDEVSVVPPRTLDGELEPNDSVDEAAVPPPGDLTGLAIGANDSDWFTLRVPKHTLATVGATFVHASGDLDLSAYDAGGACLGGRTGDAQCAWSQRDFETGEEFLSVLNGGAQGAIQPAWRLRGYLGATNTYTLQSTLVPFTDGRDCTPTYTSFDCLGGSSYDNVALLQLPFPDPNDDFVGDGYRLESPGNYRWARRELIMLVRWAIHETQLKFPGTKALGIGDVSQRNARTPGYDVGNPRHAESTHDQGANVDLAYFSTLGANGTLPYNQTRIICDANQGTNDGQFCTSGAVTSHIVDLPRQVYFMAKLYESARVRVIGVDEVIAPLLVAEAERQKNLGWITQASRNAFGTKLGFGDGWPFHHHNIHLSLAWWAM